MPDSFLIDDLLEDEIETAVALWQVAGLTRPWNDAEADARRAITLSASTILAARLEGNLVGTAMVGHDGHRGWVYYLAVSPEKQRQGIGRALMHAAENWTTGHGIPKIQLMIRQENSTVIQFYESLGYTPADVVVMGRRLDS